MNEANKISGFVNELANKYTPFFDVYRDEKLNDFSLPFMAIYKRRDERYMISKKIKVYGVENQQLVFTSICHNQISIEHMQRFQKAVEENMFAYIPDDNEHMSTIILCITVTDQQVDKTIIKEVKRFRKLKFLKFGFHGWIEMYKVLINLKDYTVYVHPKGKPFVKSIEKLLKGEGIQL
ncbi:hypothetical protein [Pallidibacillus thermolactis]|uniref:hypothetical protein n=1 Tax=Pallidibacillus thermolactis TaxID=251051 RepID=UPI0021D9A290|nr:hypothetical protein [Pallidibacillus thermolactis]MCU9601919.1 hypothetical protein [Pallidibacillus thermolactis subsp. kokeshiiformis]